MIIFIFIFLICLLLIISPFILNRVLSSRIHNNNDNNGNTLLVIAHPDDECLFFSPILLSLQTDTYILCLSNGTNHRSEELKRSCKHLRIKDYKIIDDQINLKDSMSISWSSDAILGHVKLSIRQWNISRIISFDQYGISGHLNHSSIYYALLKLSHTSQIQLLSLQTIPIYRKYFTLFEFIRLCFMSKKDNNLKTFVLPVKDTFTPYKAMFEHRSQLVWFRYLYLLFSRYIWINDFRVVH